jgi:hypothetical protein
VLKSAVIVSVLGGLCVLASTAQAQDRAAGAAPDDRAEVTTYVFSGTNIRSGVGAAVRWPLTGPLSLELETNYRQGEIGALSSHLSLLSDLPGAGRVTPYVAAGIGLEQYGTPVVAGVYDPGATQPRRAIVTAEQTAFVLNAGGGVRVRGGENWGVRSDARYFNGLGAAPERFRVYNGLTFRPGAK